MIQSLKVKLFFLLALGVLLGASAQFEIPGKPRKQTALYDYADVLNNNEERALTQKLIRYADSTSTQIVVVSIPSTDGEDIQFLGANWLSAWGIGQAGKDNGILILLARDDRRIDTCRQGYAWRTHGPGSQPVRSARTDTDVRCQPGGRRGSVPAGQHGYLEYPGAARAAVPEWSTLARRLPAFCRFPRLRTEHHLCQLPRQPRLRHRRVPAHGAPRPAPHRLHGAVTG